MCYYLDVKINLNFFAKMFGGLKYVRIFVSTITQKQNKMNYKEFYTEALTMTETKLTKNEMQFAYIVYKNFNISVSDALEISIEK